MATQNGADASILPLPKGGGAGRAIDESFQINLNTGAGLYQIPLKLPKGRDDLTPQLALAYTTGHGNGPYGLGWSMRLPSIRRDPGRRGEVFLFDGRELADMGGGRFQPLAEAEFSRILRQGDGWEITTKTGQTMRLGQTAASRSGDGVRVLEWHLDEINDINGNAILCNWEADGGRAYLSRVSYAIYELHFAYEARPDAFSSFADGYEIRTSRRCREIALRLQGAPVKAYRLIYGEAPYSGLSLLTQVQLVAQETGPGGLIEQALPPVTLEYQGFDPAGARLEVLDAGVSQPPSLSGSDVTLLDFDGAGIPGVIRIADGAARYWPRGRSGWETPYDLGNLPTGANLAKSLIFADMEGNGTADLLDTAEGTSGYYPNRPGEGWARKISYAQAPSARLGTPEARLVDLDGDARLDLVTSDGRTALQYFNRGAEGWDPQPVVARVGADFPTVDLRDPHVRFADMAGDGKAHLVVLHDRRVVWYPNLGDGRWGAARRMTNAPALPRNYDPARLFLADIDGGGVADIVYVDIDRVHVWINRSGDSFSDPIVIVGTPPMANAAVLMADMMGRGTVGVVWSYEAQLRRADAYRYLDIAGGRKPYLLARIVNNKGVETRLGYGASTDWARDLDDPDIEARGFLPFPVPVVRSLDVSDPATGTTAASRFEYRNGHFDGATRTFMGFGRGTRIDLGDVTQPGLRTVSYFHIVDPALKGCGYLSRVFGEDDAPVAHRPFEEEESTWSVRALGSAPDGRDIRHVAKTTTVKRVSERTADVREVRTDETYDAFGNVSERRIEATWSDETGAPRNEVKITSMTHSDNLADWRVGYTVREVCRDGAGALLSAKITFYDGPDFIGLPEGQVSSGNITRELVLAMLPAQNVFGHDLATLAAAGYGRIVDPEIGEGFWATRISQRRDAGGLIAERRDAMGNPTTLTFDPHGIHPVRIGFANGTELRAEYEYRYGSLTRYTDVAGVDQVFDFDGAGRLVSVTRFDDPPGQPYLRHEYDDLSRPTATTTLTRSEPGGPASRRIEYFDGAEKSIQVRAEAEDGRIVVTGRKVLNTFGKVAEEFEPYFAATLDYGTADQTSTDRFTSYRFDARGRSVTRIDWDGNVFTTEFGLGFATNTDPIDRDASAGNTAANTPQTIWTDAHARVIAAIEAREGGSYVTRYSYDAAGRRTGVEINGGRFLSNEWDCMGRRIRSDYRDAGVWTFWRDAAGNLIERVDGKGDRVHRAYDALNRLTELRHGGFAGTVEERYAYDAGAPGDTLAVGKLMAVTGPFGEVRYTYGRCGCLKTKTRVYPGLAEAQTVTYRTDSLGRYTKVVYPDGTEQDFTYGPGGLIASIPGIVDSFDYTATGRKRRVNYSSGVVADFEYETGSQRLLRIRTTAPDGITTYQDAGYVYDVLGQITAITDMANAPGHVSAARGFGYDALQQLAQATGTDANGAYVHDYAYDAQGNLVTNPEAPGAIAHGDAAHPFRVTAPGYVYDAAGNITATPDCQFGYDARNRLVRVAHQNGTVVAYAYDHLGVRVTTAITVGAVTDNIRNFDDIFLIEGATRTRIVHDGEGPLALIRPAGGAVFLKDHLGSHIAAVDLATGALIDETGYYAFGRVSRPSALIGPFRYNGKKYSELPELSFYGGRYYLPLIGRFLTADPYFLEQQPDKFFEAPRSMQLYTYVLNNPVNMTDPYGLFIFALVALVVVGFAVGVAAHAINAAVSGASFQWSEALMAGLMGALTFGLVGGLLGVGAALIVGAAMLIGPALTGALDKASMGNSFGERFLGFLSFMIKFAASPVTTTIGFLIGAFGTGLGLWGNVEWFKGGVIAFEYNSGAAGFSAVTLGGTVNIWQGNTNNPLFAHELYHSRQYTYFGDAFIPFWLLGGVYGLISSAAAGNFQWSCFSSGNPGSGYGNPLEDGAHATARGGGCT